MLYATLAAEWHFLVNPIMPILSFGMILLWGWIVSGKLDKDALYYHFPRVQWNFTHLTAGLIGFAVTLIPVPVPWWFAISFPAGVLIMFGPIFIYWYYRNKRVPEGEQYHLSTDRFRESMQRRAAAKATASAAITLIDSEGVSRIPPDKESEVFPVHIAMEGLLTPAFLARASRIEVLPAKNGQYGVAQYVDSIRYRRDPLDAAGANAITNYLKSHAGLDPKDVRRKQIGDMSTKFGTDTHDLRIRTAGSSHGQTLIIDIDLRKRVKVKPDNLGLLPRQFKKLDEVTADNSGIVLVSSSKGGGRSTTLYTLISRLDAFTSNIRTLEVEQLLQLDGVGHMQFAPTEDGPDFSTQLRSILRRDPNVVMVSDLVDSQTAKEAAGPGPDGPLMFIGLQADSGLEGLATWCKAVGDLPKASAPLRAVVHGLLLRRLCENCRLAYSPPAEQLKKLGLPADQVKQLFKPTGKILERNKEETCPVCGGLGYRGLVGCYEVMAFDDEARALIAKGDLNGLRAHLARMKMITLQQAALRKAIEGVTSIEEVIRATRTASSKKKKTPSGSSAKKQPATQS